MVYLTSSTDDDECELYYDVQEAPVCTSRRGGSASSWRSATTTTTALSSRHVYHHVMSDSDVPWVAADASSSSRRRRRRRRSLTDDDATPLRAARRSPGANLAQCASEWSKRRRRLPRKRFCRSTDDAQTPAARTGSSSSWFVPSAALSSSSTSSVSCLSHPPAVVDKGAAVRAIAVAEETLTQRFGCSPPPQNGALPVPRMEASSEVVQFRNLDTGEVRYFPMESVEAAAEKAQDIFTELFGDQRTLQRLHQTRNASDGGTDHEDASDDDDDDDDASETRASTVTGTGNSALPSSGPASKLRALFSRQSGTRRLFFSTSSSCGDVDPPGGQRSVGLFSRFRRMQSATSAATVRAEAPDGGSWDSTSSPNAVAAGMSHDNKTVPPAALVPENAAERRPWYHAFRRNSNATPLLPIHVPTRTASAKETQCLTDLWLVKEMHTPEPVPVWSLAISPDGRWIAAGSQDGSISLWAVRLRHDEEEAEEKGRADQDGGGTGVLSSYETVDLTTPCWDSHDATTRQITSLSTDTPRGDPDDVPLIFDPTPTIVLSGHTATIVMCQWDRSPLYPPEGTTNRLASASLDRTVRIWTIDRVQRPPPPCVPSLVLHCADWSTAVCFHPVVRDLLYTGALDGTIQVWRIPVTQQPPLPTPISCPLMMGEGEDVTEEDQPGWSRPDTSTPVLKMRWSNVQSQQQQQQQQQLSARSRRVEMLEYMRMTELVTAMAISPNGKLLAVGLRSGRVSVYEARSLRFCTEVDCRNKRGKYATGRKVTGLCWTADSTAVCVSTSDSRLRIIPLNDVSNWLKFKGHTNTQMMLYAQYTPLEQHVICGSESSWVFTWNLHPLSPRNPLVSSRLAAVTRKKKPTNAQAEKFKAFGELLTACVVGNRALEHTVAQSIRRHTPGKETAWARVQDGLRKRHPAPTVASQMTSLHGLVILAASYKGVVRVFVNTGHPC